MESVSAKAGGGGVIARQWHVNEDDLRTSTLSRRLAMYQHTLTC
jgi:hypothetical protein